MNIYFERLRDVCLRVFPPRLRPMEGGEGALTEGAEGTEGTEGALRTTV
jgi:hypothetical protein